MCLLKDFIPDVLIGFNYISPIVQRHTTIVKLDKSGKYMLKELWPAPQKEKNYKVLIF